MTFKAGQSSMAFEDYSALVGWAGKTINDIRDKSGAGICMTEKKDKPPLTYYVVHYSGTTDQIQLAKKLVLDAIKNTDKIERKKYDFGVKIDCHKQVDKMNCQCKFSKGPNDSLMKLKITAIGSIILLNMATILGLPENIIKSCRLAYDSSNTVIAFTLEVDEQQALALQNKFKAICIQTVGLQRVLFFSISFLS